MSQGFDLQSQEGLGIRCSAGDLKPYSQQNFITSCFFFPGDMWDQITAGEGSAYLTERAEDAHQSRDAYEAQPEPRIRYSSHAWAFSTVLNLKIQQKP